MVIIGCADSNIEKKYTPESYQKTLDSTLTVQFSKIEKEFMDDFRRRKQILVKPIVDSLMGNQKEMPSINYPKDAP